MDRPLRPGDWVRCVHGYNGMCRKGGLYRIMGVFPDGVTLYFEVTDDEGFKQPVWSERFEFIGELASIALEIEHGQTPTAG